MDPWIRIPIMYPWMRIFIIYPWIRIPIKDPSIYRDPQEYKCVHPSWTTLWEIRQVQEKEKRKCVHPIWLCAGQ